MAYASEMPRAEAGLFQGWMTDMIETYKLRRARRDAYLTTLRELKQMNEAELSDIGLSGLMIHEIARKAAAQVTL